MKRLFESFKARVANKCVKVCTQILDTDILRCGFCRRVECGDSGFDSGLLCGEDFIECRVIVGVSLCGADSVSDSKVLFHDGNSFRIKFDFMVIAHKTEDKEKRP